MFAGFVVALSFGRFTWGGGEVREESGREAAGLGEEPVWQCVPRWGQFPEG